LPARTYRFGLQSLALVDQLPREVQGWTFAKKLVRCGTSIGANVQKTDHALANKEFASTCDFARGEFAESHHHLRLARVRGLLTGPLVEVPIGQSKELL
jgi:four helix bundle protein